MKTHITKNHTKKDKNKTSKPHQKEDITEDDTIKKMYEKYGTGTTNQDISQMPLIEDILNYDKDDKTNEVENEIAKENSSVMEVEDSLEDQNKILKTEKRRYKRQDKRA